jgi:ABC-type antimicrobial peptide transport system permease subunit
MINTTAGFLGLLATGLGIPLGLAFAKGLLRSLAELYGFGEVQVSLNFIHAILLIPAMVAVSMIGSYIPGQQAARLSIVHVLRRE